MASVTCISVVSRLFFVLVFRSSEYYCPIGTAATPLNAMFIIIKAFIFHYIFLFAYKKIIQKKKPYKLYLMLSKFN